MHLSHILIYIVWSHWLECGVIPHLHDCEEEERLLYHSKYLLAKHTDWWQHRQGFTKTFVLGLLQKPYLQITFIQWFKKNQGRKEKENILLVWVFFLNTWQKLGDCRPASEESLCWLCLACVSRLLNYVISTHKVGSEISLSGYSFKMCK